MSDDLVSLLSGLNVASVPETIQSTRLSYAAFSIKPSADLLNPNAIVEGDVNLSSYLLPNISASDLPALKNPLPLPLTIQPFTKTVDPAPKPNLVLILASLFSLTVSQAPWKTLSRYDIIMPRKVLSTILANKQNDIEAYAWRPSPESPLFIDRKSSYSTNPGTIGMQFEEHVVNQRSDNFRFYGVFEIVLDGRLKIVVSGEIDAVDEASNAPIEIKTKPSWSRSNREREFDTWLQAKIGCVQEILAAGFTAGRGVRNGPVSFKSSNVSKRQPDEYFNVGDSEQKNLDAGVKFLDAVVKGCTSTKKVYKVSCGPDNLPVMTLEDDLAHCTVTEQLIEHVASMKWP